MDIEKMTYGELRQIAGMSFTENPLDVAVRVTIERAAEPAQPLPFSVSTTRGGQSA